MSSSGRQAPAEEIELQQRNQSRPRRMEDLTPEQQEQVRRYRERQRAEQQRQQQEQGQARSDDDADEEEQLKYGATTVIQLIVPVTLCMIVVVATIQSIQYYAQDSGDYLYYIAFNEQNESNGARFGGAIVNALIIIAVIIVMTCVLVLLYKYRCYRAIWLWLFASTVMLLFLFSYVYLQNVFDRYNVAMDWITFAGIIWNFGIVGVIAVHWKAPLRLQQVYLIITSALLALTLIKHLPEWTTWVLLAAIAIYDLFAVLCPRGPLKVLVETAAERDEPIFPALIYSSTVMYAMVNHQSGGNNSDGDHSDSDSDDNDHALPPSATATATATISIPADDPGFISSSSEIDASTRSPIRTKRVSSATDPAPRASLTGGSRARVAPAPAPASADANLAEARRARQAREQADAAEHTAANMKRSRDSSPPSPASTVGSTNSLLPRGNGNVSGAVGRESSLTGSNAPIHEQAQPASATPEDEDEDSGVKLGLGDFIFYSVLVGKAATRESWTTILASFIAILTGLCLTLLLLAIYRKALPALPISIGFGIIFYFASTELIVPFVSLMSSRQAFL